MILNIDIKDQIKIHALACRPKECCGIIVQLNGTMNKAYLACNNLSHNEDSFIIDPEYYILAESKGKILAIVHSHVNNSTEMSMYDKASYSKDTVAWIIYSLKDNQFAEYDAHEAEPIPPLLGRQFYFGIQDCYSIIKDYYKINLNIELPEAVREDKFWHRGENLYMDNYLSAGFVEVPISDLKVHDVILMKLGVTSIPNHGAIYIENNHIVHHVQNRLSEKTLYIRKWRDITTNILRHSNLI